MSIVRKQSYNHHPKALFEKTFGQVQLHQQIGLNIEHYSTNKQNIYQQALEHISYNKQIEILDIGCGYGRFSGNLESVPGIHGSRCTGIDLLATNCESFIKTLTQAGLQGEYITGQANQITDFTDSKYDLVLSSFSLNFFPEVLPDIARIIKPAGSFIAITHSNRFLKQLEGDIAAALKLFIDRDFQLPTIAFSAENGQRLLSKYFDIIQKIDYSNQLIFPLRQIKKCLMYIDFKLPFLIKPDWFSEQKLYNEFRNELHRQIRRKTRENHYYYLNKDDCIFKCNHPRN